jgi:Sel1 repeat
MAALWGAIAALVLAGCATAPPKTRPLPFEQALTASARQGNPRAQFSLGLNILARPHTASEQSAAVAWITRAAHANLAMAQDRLGWMYLTGRDEPQDTARALDWLQRAANSGAPAAQLQLAAVYAAGTLVPVDKARAYYWYSIAAKPAASDVTIFNIRQVRSFAQKRAQTLGDSLRPDQRASVGRQVAAWVPTPSVPYSATVSLISFLR